jgi:N-acetylglucosaminyl-diphospho-decaprenol L-rhamnosyltransferase
MNVTTYIPNLNARVRLLRTLATLAGQSRPPQVVVVDNASTDGSVAAVRAEFPDVALLELRRNVGFGAALNYAVREYPSDVLLFLNNDVECDPRFVEAMCEQFDGRNMVAGVLLQHRDPGLIDSAGVVIDRTLMAFDYLHGEPVSTLDDARPPVGPTGGCALFSADAFELVGGFDDRMFAYLEDVDLVLRLRETGVACAFARHARASHRHSATLGSGSVQKDWHMGWSRGYMLRRYGVLRDVRNVPRTLAAETVICVGQIVVDRTSAGVRGRIAGWRSAAKLPGRPTPGDGILDVTLQQALEWRSRRRKLPGGVRHVLGPLLGGKLRRRA